MDPNLHLRWVRYKGAQDRLAWWAKTSNRFTRTNNEPNTYILFTELAAELAGDRGRVGLIVKTGFVADEGPSKIWHRLVKAGRVREVRDIVNSGPGNNLVFKDVAAVERFSILVLGPERPAGASFEVSMLNFGVEAAASTPTLTWDESLLGVVCPVTKTLPSPASDGELDVLFDLHHRNGTLDFAGPNAANPWGIEYHRLFDSSGAKKDGLVHRGEVLLSEGWVLGIDKRMVRNDSEIALPVYEGQMVGQWDHRRKTFEGFGATERYGRKPDLPW